MSGVGLACVVSILGYCLLPMVITMEKCPMQTYCIKSGSRSSKCPDRKVVKIMAVVKSVQGRLVLVGIIGLAATCSQVATGRIITNGKASIFRPGHKVKLYNLSFFT